MKHPISQTYGLPGALMLGALMLGAGSLAAATAPVTASDNIPDAMQHMVKAPEIDFANLRDPFASYLARVAPQGRTTLHVNQQRLNSHKRTKLEEFDLDALKLVAIFSMGGERVAMVQDTTSKGYIVRRGDYMGKHNGKIEKIDDNTLFLVEQVLNPAGDVIDRQVTLTLKEVNE